MYPYICVRHLSLSLSLSLYLYLSLSPPPPPPPNIATRCVAQRQLLMFVSARRCMSRSSHVRTHAQSTHDLPDCGTVMGFGMLHTISFHGAGCEWEYSCWTWFEGHCPAHPRPTADMNDEVALLALGGVCVCVCVIGVLVGAGIGGGGGGSVEGVQRYRQKNRPPLELRHM